MDDKIIKFKNRVEVKILKIFYLVVFLPIFILLVIEIIKNGFNEMWPYIFMFTFFVILFIGILVIINRFNITFDFVNNEMRYTSYFGKTKVYKFVDVKIYYCKGKTTLPNDYVYNFIYNNRIVFKISFIDFESQTKKSEDILKSFFRDNQKDIYELEKEIKIPNGELFVITYELDEDIAVAYLPNGITIDLGYIKSDQKFYITVYKDGDWNNQLEVIEVEDINIIKQIFQDTINKYTI